jgi:hypothetical protein
MTVVLYLSVRRRLDSKEGAFNLGRFESPVAVFALVWVVGAAFVSIMTAPTIVPSLIVAGMLLAGAGYLGYLMKCQRQVLEHEPGDAGRTSDVERDPVTVPTPALASC